MDTIDRLTALFERFPGIGPRQAGRFVQFLLRTSPALRRELASLVGELGNAVSRCPRCMRFWAQDTRERRGASECHLCANPARDPSMLAVVAADADLSALERSGTYRGHYFVLGGTVSLDSDRMNGLHAKELLASLPKRVEDGLLEIILAFPANPEGDATALRLQDDIRGIQNHSIKVTTLGRGLSTGSELEYADAETIKSALENRRQQGG